MTEKQIHKNFLAALKMMVRINSDYEDLYMAELVAYHSKWNEIFQMEIV